MKYEVTKKYVEDGEGNDYRVYGLSVRNSAASGEWESVYAFDDVSTAEVDVKRLIGRLENNAVPMTHLHYEVMKYIESGYTA